MQRRSDVYYNVILRNRHFMPGQITRSPGQIRAPKPLMNPYPQRLDPPNEQKHTVLPDHTQSASTEAGTFHSLLKTYRNGISFIDPLGSVQGALTGHLTFICGFGFIG